MLHPSQALSEPIWYLDRKGEIPEGKLPYLMLPIVNYHEVRAERMGGKVWDMITNEFVT